MKIIQEEIMVEIIQRYNNGESPDKLSKIYIDYSPYIIRENLKYYGVFKSPYFTEQELSDIRQEYLDGISLQDIAKKHDRRVDVIRKKLQELKVYATKKYEPYSEDEISILRKYYGNCDWNILLKLLPNRDKQSIITKASKLGLKHDKLSQINNLLSEYNLKMLDDFKTINSKYKFIDNDGYLYYVQLGNLIYAKNKPMPFSYQNPYTIDNIKRYIELNHIDCKLLSTVYDKSSTKMLWECSCGNQFLCSWTKFLQGKHKCNDCTKQNCIKSYSIEQVKEMIKDKPYKMVESSFSSLTNGFTAITDEGYYVTIDRGTLSRNSNPEIFHKHNPYTIQNIKHYLEINNIKTELLSTEYNDNATLLLWKCKCGNIFKRNWNTFLHGENDCRDCIGKRNGLKKRIDIEDIKKAVHKMDLSLIDESMDKAVTSDKISLIDNEGYLYYAYWSSIRNGKLPEKFYDSNIYSIDNINNLMRLERNGEYTCISKTYVNNSHKLKFRHNCGHVFKASLVEMQGKVSPNGVDKYYKQCPRCNKNKTESNHALILKQIFLHNYPDTILEDRSCINPKTKRAFPTDIVNHRLKIAVEIQSSYHDKPEKQKVDKFKKAFWLNKGYSFYDPDIRNYSILEMIQIFFPKISCIPEYVNYNFSNCIDYTQVQLLLNEGYTMLEIARITGIKHGTIQGFVRSKKVFLPAGYKEKLFNIRTIIQLNKNGEYINKFPSISDMDRHGFKAGTVNRVLKGKQKFAYNCFWLFEEDYLNKNYTIPQDDKDKFLISVDKFDMNDNYIKSYNTIYEAEQDSMSSKSEIYRVASGDRKSTRNEKWKFTMVA